MASILFCSDDLKLPPSFDWVRFIGDKVLLGLEVAVRSGDAFLLYCDGRLEIYRLMPLTYDTWRLKPLLFFAVDMRSRSFALRPVAPLLLVASCSGSSNDWSFLRTSIRSKILLKRSLFGWSTSAARTLSTKPSKLNWLSTSVSLSIQSAFAALPFVWLSWASIYYLCSSNPYNSTNIISSSFLLAISTPFTPFLPFLASVTCVA